MYSHVKILDVPYYVQPTSNTCQSTCLKMFANYVEERFVHACTGAGDKDILEIWNDINTGNERPTKGRNSYQNMKWWLEKHFSGIKVEVTSTKNPDNAVEACVEYIDKDFPVMVSTNHARTEGHIILVIGYKDYDKQSCSTSIKFICHDPAGRFNPQLNSRQFGKRKYEGGMTLSGNRGEVGPGKLVSYDINGIRRVRPDCHSSDTYYLISGRMY